MKFRTLIIGVAVILAAALSLVVGGSSVAASTAKGDKVPTLSLTLQQGEAGSTSLVLNEKPTNAYEVASLVLTARNGSAAWAAPGAVPNSSYACQATISGVGGAGNTLWTWQVTEGYDANGSYVSWWGTVTNPSTNWPGWSFDHSSYVSTGNYTYTYRSTSTGYFKYDWFGVSDRKYGKHQFLLYGDGSCTVTSTSGNW